MITDGTEKVHFSDPAGFMTGYTIDTDGVL